jgi:hypothetical protein
MPVDTGAEAQRHRSLPVRGGTGPMTTTAALSRARGTIQNVIDIAADPLTLFDYVTFGPGTR